MKEVIVIGGDHHNTLAVLRSLGPYTKNTISDPIKIRLIVISDIPRPFVTYSRYVYSFDIISNINELPDLLLSTYKSSPKPIIVSCSDSVASCIDLHYNSLIKYFILPSSNSQGKITTLMNKSVMAKLAVESGLNIPKSIEIKTSEIDNEFINNLFYPCITKPLVSINGSKEDIQVFKNPHELRNKIKKFESEFIQIQEFIDKKYEYQLIGCSLEGGQNVIIPGASIIIRQPENTNTGFLRYIPKFKTDLDACKKFLKASDFSGLFSMEFLRDKNGKDFYMETNFRNDGNAICVTASGMNLPYIWVLHNSGSDITNYMNSCNMREVLVMPEFNDLHNVKSGSISLIKWLVDVYHTDCFMEFDRHDPKPFWIQVGRKLRLLK